MLYNLNALHYQIVWPVGIAYVKQNELVALEHARAYRPSDYKGGEFDKAAWAAYSTEKALTKIRKDWPGLTVTAMPDGRFSFSKN